MGTGMGMGMTNMDTMDDGHDGQATHDNEDSPQPPTAHAGWRQRGNRADNDK
jgi:hypothetical protein